MITPRRRRRGPSEIEYTPGFLRFWEAYPRKNGKGKAIKAWPGDELLETILAALAWQVPTWTDMQYVKYPASWLNARCWEDEKPQPTPLRPTHDIRHGHHRAEDTDWSNVQAGEQKL